MSEILESALRYARMGWPALPCDGKNPNVLGSDWQRKATSDEATITRWYTQLSRANNVGVLTGEKFFVLDIDRKHGGYEALDALLRDYAGQLPDTLQQISGGGGRHYFFQIPAGETIRSCKIRPGVEIKGYHGFSCWSHPFTRIPASGMYSMTWKIGRFYRLLSGCSKSCGLVASKRPTLLLVSLVSFQGLYL